MSKKKNVLRENFRLIKSEKKGIWIIGLRKFQKSLRDMQQRKNKLQENPFVYLKIVIKTRIYPINCCNYTNI